MIIDLTHGELLIASQTAAARNTWAAIFACKAKHGQTLDARTWGNHTSGCIGEFAVAKYLNLYWSPTIGEFGRHDVGGLVEVRSIERASHRLIVNPDDKPERPFVLAFIDLTRGNGRTLPVDLRGWIFGVDAQQDKHWGTLDDGRPPTFAVRQHFLSPMPELKTWVLEQLQNGENAHAETCDADRRSSNGFANTLEQ